MNKFIKLLIFCIGCILVALPLQAYSERDLDEKKTPSKTTESQEGTTIMVDRKELFTFLESAFAAQVALSEKGRSLEEIKAELEPFFSDSYTELFLDENIVEENGEYFTYGSDAALYYIPFFSYSDKTKVVPVQDSLFVGEVFSSTLGGPVAYHNGTIFLELTREAGELKIVKIWYGDVPEEVQKQIEPTA